MAKKKETLRKSTDFSKPEPFEFDREGVDKRFITEVEKIVGGHNAAVFPSIAAFSRAIGYKNAQTFTNIKRGYGHVTVQMLAGLHLTAGKVVDIRYILTGQYSKENDGDIYGLPRNILSIEKESLKKIGAYADLIDVEVQQVLNRRRT